LTRPFPLQRSATPKEIATTVLLLVFDRAAYNTSTIVTIDGGMANA
jgi:NAD(P)-dependent dehydrogenase (short-subunit alcohol dehydrogenase family)